MSGSNILISLSAYKEAENIVKITEKIRDQFNDVKILIVNDFSGDNTEELIKKKRDKNENVSHTGNKYGMNYRPRYEYAKIRIPRLQIE